MKKAFRILFWIVCGLIVLVALFVVVSVIPVDRTNYVDLPHYARTMRVLDSVQNISIPEPTTSLRVGYGKSNLVPPFPVATAGYGKRRGKIYTAVHDSVFVRSVVVANGNERAAIVSADLLIIPPAVTEALALRLPKIGFSLDNTYLNATHTHNSIGNWGEGAAGFIYGSYNDSIVSFITDKIIESVIMANNVLVEAKMQRGHTFVSNAVVNRLDRDHGTVDSSLHVIDFIRQDSVRIAILSYNAHATCLFSKDLELSRDYPGALVDSVENLGYDFAMFLSGAVGSHATRAPEAGKPCLGWMASELLLKFKELQPGLIPVKDSTIMFIRTPLYLGEPQFKIAAEWRLRPWLFRNLLGEYQPYLTALRMGDVILLGTPCDFSGELTAAVRAPAAAHGFHTIVTSFNGHYIGYVTNDNYFDSPHYETRLMNWYGPGNGAYLTECLQKLQTATYH